MSICRKEVNLLFKGIFQKEQKEKTVCHTEESALNFESEKLEAKTTYMF